MKRKIFSIESIIRQFERGQAIIIFVLMLFLVFFGAVGAIDLGVYIRAKQRLEITVDAAILAGSQELPTSGTNATSKALEYVHINDSDVEDEDVDTSFRCLIGDRDHDGDPDLVDIPVVCDPGGSDSFNCENGLCISPCEFTGDNTCNVMAVTASKEVPLFFTTVLDLPPLLVTASRTGACKGLCGEMASAPLDVIIVLDRTGSMSTSELRDAKDGARAVLSTFNPELQHVGLAVLGAGSPSNPCVEKLPDYGGNWLVVPLSNDYKNMDGTLNESSDLVATIECLQRASWTNLGGPLSDNVYKQLDALDELNNSTRDVKQGIIMMTDGAANRPTSKNNPCKYAYNRANKVKDKDIEIYTIGYGIQNEWCEDYKGPYRTYTRVTELLADMASYSEDDHGHCIDEDAVDAENSDGDHFLCKPKGGDLEEVFRIAAIALSSDIKLILYPD